MRLTQKIMTFLLLLAVLMQLSSSLIVVISFEINRKYIKENFCININRPTLGCDGKCFLMQKMKQQQNKAQSQQAQLLATFLEKEMPLWLTKHYFLWEHWFAEVFKNTLRKHEPTFYHTIVLRDILRPPSFLIY